MYSPLHHHSTAQIPPSGLGLMRPFLVTDSLATPTAQAPLSPTSTSQKCLPQANRSQPSTQSTVSNLSGFLGRCCHAFPQLTLFRYSDRMSWGWAVAGSRVTFTKEEEKTNASKAELRPGKGWGHSSPSPTAQVWLGPSLISSISGLGPRELPLCWG